MITPSPNVKKVLLNSEIFTYVMSKDGFDNAIRSLDFSSLGSHPMFVEKCKATIARIDCFDWYLCYSPSRVNRLREIRVSSYNNQPYFTLLGLFLDTWDNTKWYKCDVSKLPTMRTEDSRISDILGIPRAYIEIMSAAEDTPISGTSQRGLYHDLLTFLLKASGYKG